MSTHDVAAIWHEVTEKVKTRIVLPSLWRVMEAAHPIAVDNDLLILGFTTEGSHGAGLIQDAKNLNIIERAVEETAGQPWRLKLIQGETMEDWLVQRKREEEAAAFTKSTQERKRREATVEQGWDGVMERLTRRYAELPLRNLPQTQAAYLDEALGVLAEAVSRLIPDVPTEADQRALARTLEKVADRSGVPGPMVAFLLRQRTGQR